jgi:hypothetical protein
MLANVTVADGVVRFAKKRQIRTAVRESRFIFSIQGEAKDSKKTRIINSLV